MSEAAAKREAAAGREVSPDPSPSSDPKPSPSPGPNPNPNPNPSHNPNPNPHQVVAAARELLRRCFEAQQDPELSAALAAPPRARAADALLQASLRAYRP